MDRYPFIDRSRVGVMGTNYGASLAALVAGQNKMPLCGVLTAPITQWRYHGILGYLILTLKKYYFKMFLNLSCILASQMILLI